MVKIKILKVNLKKLSQNIEENGSKGWLVVGGAWIRKLEPCPRNSLYETEKSPERKTETK